MKYFFDTEFIEDGKTIDLISIGIVTEDGRELYLGNSECDMSKASQWVKDNVLIPMGVDYSSPNIPMRPIDPLFWMRKERIAHEILDFIKESEYPHSYLTLEEKINIYLPPKKQPEFWAYYADYDWVVFCQLWGTMMDLPQDFPRYCRDIKQECDRLGNPKLPEQGKGEHNALADARWNKQVYEFLRSL